MDLNILQIGNVVGYILQSIYFSCFIINTKQIKEKRILFTICVFIEFIFIKYACKLNYTVNSDIVFGMIFYLLITIFYNKKGRITDFITYIISVLILEIISVIVSMTIGMNFTGLIFSNMLSLIFIHFIKHKLYLLENFYNKFWNRHKNNKVIKSITVRGISSVLTIFTFIFAHMWLIYGILIVRR